MHVNVIGGGLGGLISAITAREAGSEVTVHEALPQLGGRGRTTAGPHRANRGPHVVYADGPLWAWLAERGLTRPYRRPPNLPRLRFRVDGRSRRLPPARFITAVMRLRRTPAPVDATFTEWATTVVDDADTVAQVASAMGVATFHHAPGTLSAAFVQERLRRVTALPPSARYVEGGWGSLVDRLADRARTMGVTIETGSRVETLPEPPVILALPLRVARHLLDDAGVVWMGARTALLDVGIRRHRADAFIVSDLDECGWAEAFSMPDPTLAPPGEHLVQAQIGLRPDEDLDQGVARIEALLDAGYPGWQARETWRRRIKVEDESGALDPPGTTWRDRPAIDRGDGVYLVGDMVAAPGLLSEVSHASAMTAVGALAGTTAVPGRSMRA